MRRILVTNDDGYFSEGIKALADALRPSARSPSSRRKREASAVGHALTLRRPLRLEHIGERVYSVDGTPTDCVNIAIHEVLDRRAGSRRLRINKGLNIGDDITYSGTVAGALEGALLGLSGDCRLAGVHEGEWDFSGARRGRVRGSVARAAAAVPDVSQPQCPAGRPAGVRVTCRRSATTSRKSTNGSIPRQRPYFWIEEAQDDWEPDPRSDYQAIRDGYISVTPLHPDLTGHG